MVRSKRLTTWNFFFLRGRSFQIRSHSVAEAGFELMVNLLFQPSECWDYGCKLLHLGGMWEHYILGTTFSTLHWGREAFLSNMNCNIQTRFSVPFLEIHTVYFLASDHGEQCLEWQTAKKGLTHAHNYQTFHTQLIFSKCCCSQINSQLWYIKKSTSCRRKQYPETQTESAVDSASSFEVAALEVWQG